MQEETIEDETIDQLQQILELFDRYTNISKEAFIRVEAWFNHDTSTFESNNPSWVMKTRREQAGQLITWFTERIENENSRRTR